MVSLSPRNRFDAAGARTGLSCFESYCCEPPAPSCTIVTNPVSVWTQDLAPTPLTHITIQGQTVGFFENVQFQSATDSAFNVARGLELLIVQGTAFLSWNGVQLSTVSFDTSIPFDVECSVHLYPDNATVVIAWQIIQSNSLVIEFDQAVTVTDTSWTWSRWFSDAPQAAVVVSYSRQLGTDDPPTDLLHCPWLAVGCARQTCSPDATKRRIIGFNVAISGLAACPGAPAQLESGSPYYLPNLTCAAAILIPLDGQQYTGQFPTFTFVQQTDAVELSVNPTFGFGDTLQDISVLLAWKDGTNNTVCTTQPSLVPVTFQVEEFRLPLLPPPENVCADEAVRLDWNGAQFCGQGPGSGQNWPIMNACNATARIDVEFVWAP